MKDIQANILEFINDNESDCEKIVKIFDDQIIRENQHELKTVLHLLVKICNNYRRTPSFFLKIDQILSYFKNDILKYFSNIEIFNIFKSNKRILLFLIEEKVILIDNYVVKKMMKEKYREMKYPEYFFPEIEFFLDVETKAAIKDDIENQLSSNFNEKRKNGENDNFICQLIKDDLIKEFASFISRNNMQLDSLIEPSIFETNSFLLKNKATTLIEYAAFMSANEIFDFLRLSQVKLTPSLWLYSIHGQNADMIHLLEDNHVKPNEVSYKECLKESIKCHYNDLVKYIFNKYLETEEKSFDTFIQSIKYFNFEFIQNDFINETSFFYLCRYDYSPLVDAILKNKHEDINKLIILNHFF